MCVCACVWTPGHPLWAVHARYFSSVDRRCREAPSSSSLALCSSSWCRPPGTASRPCSSPNRQPAIAPVAPLSPARQTRGAGRQTAGPLAPLQLGCDASVPPPHAGFQELGVGPEPWLPLQMPPWQQTTHTHTDTHVHTDIRTNICSVTRAHILTLTPTPAITHPLTLPSHPY